MKDTRFIERLFQFRGEIYDIWSGYEVSIGVDSIVISEGEHSLTYWYPGGQEMHLEVTHSFKDTHFDLDTVIKISEAVERLLDWEVDD